MENVIISESVESLCENILKRTRYPRHINPLRDGYATEYNGQQIEIAEHKRGYAATISGDSDEDKISLRYFRYGCDALQAARNYINGNVDLIPYDVRRRSGL